MLTSKEVFTQSVEKLKTIYKNDPAKLEAVKVTSDIALSSLFEGIWDAHGFNGTQGLAQVNTRPSAKHAYKGAKAPEAPVKPNARAIAGAMTIIKKWAMSDPVGVQQWINNKLKDTIEIAAKQRFGNVAEDPMKAFEDEVSGKADTDREKAIADTKAYEEKQAAAAEKQAQKEGAKAAKAQEKEFWAKQKEKDAEDKKKYHQDEVKKIDEENQKREELRHKLEKYGLDPEMYKESKKPGLFGKLGNAIKRKWHSLQSAAEHAINANDIPRLEAIRAQMNEIKVMCESAGIDLDAILLG